MQIQPPIGRRFGSARAIMALVIRELATTNSKAMGGYFWTLLEPIASTAVMSILFSLIMRTPPIGTNFQIFYASGILVFATYRDVLSRVSSAIPASRSLLRYPAILYIDAVIARIIASVMTQIIVMFIIFVGITMIWETRTEFNPLYALSAVSSAVVLGIGFGLVNAFILSFVPIWQSIWVTINRPLILISGVIYLHDRVPQPYQDYLWWNPFVHVVGEMRRAFFPQYAGEYIYMPYPFAIGLSLTAIGLFLLNTYSRDVLMRL